MYVNYFLTFFVKFFLFPLILCRIVRRGRQTRNEVRIKFFSNFSKFFHKTSEKREARMPVFMLRFYSYAEKAT